MATREAIERNLLDLFDAERTARRLHDELAETPPEVLLDALVAAIGVALKEPREDEASLRLARIAMLLGDLEGPRAVDALIDILAADHPEARLVAGEHLESLAFERWKEVALGVERALKRLPVGSPALPELPYILAEIPEPGVTKLLAQFLTHEDPDAVAGAIEALVEHGDPAAARLLKPLLNDNRTVVMADEGEDAGDEVTLGELAAEAVALFEGDDGRSGAERRSGTH